MENKCKCCGTCKWHEIETASTCPDFVCTNEKSEFWSYYTGCTDSCDEFEERE